MSFDVNWLSIRYDVIKKFLRKLNKNQKRSVAKNATGDEKKVYTQYQHPVPYDVSFELNVFTATSDDGLTNYRTNTTILSTRLYSHYDY